MKKKEYIELINKSIDGVSTPEEQEMLQIYLAANPDILQLYQDLLQTNEWLNEIPEVEPPSHLKNKIVESIEFKPVKKSENIFMSLFSGLFSRPAFKLAYSFALGIAAGIIFYSLAVLDNGQQVSLNEEDLFGSIGLSSADFSIVELHPLELPDFSGTVVQKQKQNIIIFEFNIESSTAYEIRMNFSPASSRFLGFSPLPGSSSTFENGEDYIRIANTKATHVQLTFSQLQPESRTSSFIFELYRDGTVHSRHSFSVN